MNLSDIRRYNYKNNMLENDKKSKAEEVKILILLKLYKAEIGEVEDKWEYFKLTLVEAAEKLYGRMAGKRGENTTDWLNVRIIRATRGKNKKALGNGGTVA